MENGRRNLTTALGLLLVWVLLACGDDTTGPGEAPVLSSLAKVEGDGQADTVTRQLRPIVVQTLDQNDLPMEGVLVSFVVTSGGGSTFSGFSISDTAGLAFDVWRLGQAAGTQTVEARALVSGTREQLAVEFSATALPDSAARIELTPDPDIAERGDTIFVDEQAQYKALAFDRFENAIGSQNITWSVSNAQLATIDPNGVLTALNVGRVVVIARLAAAEARDTLFIGPARVPPVVSILEPEDGARIDEKEGVTARATASDPDGGSVTVVWESNLDGVVGQGAVAQFDLSLGWHDLTARVTDDEGEVASQTIAVRIESVPTATILSPGATRLFEFGTSISFEAVAEDRDGGPVSISWESDLDGVLGSQAAFTTSSLSAGVHRIRLRVEDDEGKVAADWHDISVQPFGTASVTALDFDFVELGGVEEDGDYVEVADDDALDLVSSWTLEAWIRPTLDGISDPNDFRHILSKWDGAGNASWVLQLKGRRVSLAVHDGSRTNTIFSDELVVADEWQHVAATFDQGQAKLYLNGILVASEQTVIPLASTQPLSIGREGLPFGGRYFGGAVDEPRIWSAARTEAEIRSTMMNSLSGSESGLVAYWRFDEGTGDIAADATAGGHDGRLGDELTPDERDPAWINGGAPVQ